MEEAKRRTGVLARSMALVAAGALAGSIMVTPVGAHVTFGVKHLINKHLKKVFYTKAQSDARYVEETAKAGDADKLDNLDSTAFQSRIHWAFVNAGGTIAAQSGGISLQSHPGGNSGDYYFRFPTVVAGKAVLATLDSDALNGEIVAGPCGGPPLGAVCAAGPNTTSDVYVATSDSAGGATDLRFYVAVFA